VDAFTNSATIAINVAGSFPVLANLPGVTGVLESADVDGDGWMDIVGGGGSQAWPPTIKVFRSRGPGLPFEEAKAFCALGGLVDLDGDGDKDARVPAHASGSMAIVSGRAWKAPASGFFRQYGFGAGGSGAFTPLLGATGPARTGRTVGFRLRDGRGGAPALLAVGLAESNLANVPLPGLTSYNSPWAALIPLTLGGASGVPGAGRLDLLAPMPPSFANTSFFLQIATGDPVGPGGIAISGGLEVHVGI
jgi:hypothetical protein